MAEHPSVRRPLRLSWSAAISGAELYDGEEVETFTTDWHFHEGWQLVAVTRGERHYQFKSSSIVAKPGRLILVPPRLVHRAHCPDQSNTSFKIATLPAVCMNMRTPAAPMSWPTRNLFDSFLSVFESLKVYRKHEPKTELLSQLETILTESRAPDALGFSTPPAFVFQVESHLLKSMETVPSLDSLACLAGVSRYHFVHSFTKHVGLSPLAFHARARLIRSRKLISEGWSLADTSLSLRFSDQSHFGRHFKSVYGMTPGEYRQSIAS